MALGRRMDEHPPHCVAGELPGFLGRTAHAMLAWPLAIMV